MQRHNCENVLKLTVPENTRRDTHKTQKALFPVGKNQKKKKSSFKLVKLFFFGSKSFMKGKVMPFDQLKLGIQESRTLPEKH